MLMKVFFEPLLCPIWSLWRPTSGKREYVSKPSDTDQVGIESKLSLFGCFAWVARDMLRKGATEGEVNVPAVLERWSDRAEDCSVAFMLLLWARFLLLILSLEGTEGDGDWVTYRLLMPCLHLLFAVANATNYVVLASYETYFWKTASRAAHILQEKVGFVKKSRFGKLIFADRFVEWSVKNMRRFVGKRMIVGMSTTIQRTCIDLSDLVKREDNVAGSAADAKVRSKVVKLKRPFWDTLRWLDHTQVLAPKGENFYTTPSVNDKGLRTRTEQTPGSLVTADGKPMNRLFFNILPEALKRTRAVNAAIFNGHSQVEVDLFVVRASSKDAFSEAEVRWIREHAVLEADLVKTFKGSPKRIYTAEEVEAEIDAALLDDRCPDWLEAQWKQAKNVGQRANLLGRVRAHFKSPEARPPRPVVDKTIYNTRDDPQVREYIQGTLSHPLIRTMRK